MPRKMPNEPQADIGGGDNEKTIAVGKLTSFVERIESIEEDQRALSEDKKQVIKDAKDEGYNTKAIKAVVKARRDPAKAQAEAEANKLYAEALGIPDVFG